IWIRNETAVWIERADGQESGGGVALIEQVDEARKDLGVLRNGISALQVHHGVSRYPAASLYIGAGAIRAARLIGVVLISVQVRPGGGDEVAPDIPSSGEIVIEHQPPRVLRNQRNSIAGADPDVPVRIRCAVRSGAHLEIRLEGCVDEAIGNVPIKSALLASQRNIETLPAGIAHVVEVTGIGRCCDELDV